MDDPEVRVVDDLERRVVLLAGLLLDLDRCEHGRHEADRCFDCPGGVSAGNPQLLQQGRRVGTTYAGQPIVYPGRERKADPDAWYPQGRR